MMKTYEGKTEDEVVQTACLDLGVTPDQLTYEVIEEKKGLFSKKVVIECYTQIGRASCRERVLTSV